MRKLLGLFLLAALPLWADTYPRPVGFVVTHYNFDVALSDANNQVAVRDTVSLRFTQDGVGQVALDLCQLRTANPPAERGNPCLVRTPYGLRGRSPGAPSSAGRGMVVTAVTDEHGAALRFRQDHDRLLVELARPGRRGQSYAFTAAYHGVPANGLLIEPNRYGDREFFTNEWPDLARNWLAVVDHPSMKATKTIRVVAPRHYQVISNGTMTEETDLPGDLRRTVWREEVPICTWQFSLGVAPMAVSNFGEFHGIPLSAWVFPQERKTGFADFQRWTEPILEFYVDHIGPYSYEKLAQVEANGTGGGMELASDIYYGYPPSGPSRQLLAHEMAHQWFGDSVTEKDWDDVWLSEGFATYFALLYTEHRDGRDAFLAGVQSSAAAAQRFVEQHPDSTLVHHNLSDISQVIANNAQIYQEGAQVLHMLRGVLGTANFWAGIRLYYRRYRNANANSLDFQHAMEEACAASATCPRYGRDLSWFFNEWLHRGGLLRAQGGWRYDAVHKQLEVTLDQTGNPGQLYQMPFQIGITLPAAAGGRGGRGRGGRRGAEAGAPPLPVLMLRAAHNTLSIPLAQAPTAVRLDPRRWVTMAQVAFGPQ
ncbi:MAG TPA: M1 family metallopeptidase [Terriglobales bacterium]|nr:M1 family metallopeptidase [Terriglobales bacterium]